MLVKMYGEGPKTEARYCPAVCIDARKDHWQSRQHMFALYTVWYNYARINSAVKMPRRWRRVTELRESNSHLPVTQRNRSKQQDGVR